MPLPLTRAIRLASAALCALLLAGSLALPAWAASGLSPGEVFIDSDVTFTISTTRTNALDATEFVQADVPVAFGVIGCSGPGGWSCSVESAAEVSHLRWTRDNSLNPTDDTFHFTAHTPVEPQEVTIAVADRSTEGELSQATFQVNVVTPPEPTDEPTEEPSEEPTEEPSEEPTVPSGPVRPEPEPTPFRPPDGEAPPPLNIDELGAGGEVANPGIVESTPRPPGGGTSTTLLVVLPVLALLALSGISFVVARMNR